MNRPLVTLFLVSAFLFGCTQSIVAPDSLAGVTLEVFKGNLGVEIVYLSLVETQDIDGEEVVPLTGILAAAGIENLDQWVFDFEAEDGFRPAAKYPCRGQVPVAGELLEKGGYAALTGSLLWEKSLGFPGCLSVQGIQRIYAWPVDSKGPTVVVSTPESDEEVDLRFLPTVFIGETEWVSVWSLVSSLVPEPDSYRYDLAGTDGAPVSQSQDGDTLAWSVFQEGLVKLSTRQLDWPEGFGVASAWKLSPLETIILVPDTER